jgi:antitoxin (DNA-binding transcriptional repressor) of toxin-antitoxin stability system
MRSVGLKVLKNKLSEYVRAAEAGETVLVTDRDRVVAEIGPPRKEEHPLMKDPFFARGVREGWLTLPTETGPLPPPPKGIMTLAELMEELDKDREDRF